jgi:uncharacterized repeat protein (TIGR01451 family)
MAIPRLVRRPVAIVAAVLACAWAAPAEGAVALSASFSIDSAAVRLLSNVAIDRYTVTLCSGPLPKIRPLGKMRRLTLGPYGSPIVSVQAKAGAKTLVAHSGADCPPRPVGAIDLTLTQALEHPGPLTVGRRFSYTLTVRNNGPGAAMNVVVRDALPAGLSYVSASAPGACSGGASIRCSLGLLGAGESAAVVITAIAVSPGSLANTASVYAAGSDTNPADDTAVLWSTVLGVLAPPVTKACHTVRVLPKRLLIGVPASLVVTVRAQGKLVPWARIVVKGGGISASARTGSHGVARLPIVARSVGPLEVRVVGEPSCTLRQGAALAA